MLIMREFTYGLDSKGNAATAYELRNANGMTVTVTDFGATLVKLEVPSKFGELVDVILGFDDVKGYEEGCSSQGATVGRIANRIGGAKFTLNEKEYTLVANNGVNNLHSGTDHYNVRMWKTNVISENQVAFVLNSPDGDQGYPGAVEFTVTYTLTEENELRIDYHGVPDADTIINMTNHSYFNLDGYRGNDVLEQKIWLDADAFTKATADSIPTGEILSVEGTPMDWRVAKAIGSEIAEDYEPLVFGNGYDHNWVLNNKGELKIVGSLESCNTGIQMEVSTDLPGIQIYTGNFLDEIEVGKGGLSFKPRAGVCFETQLFPDAIHHDNFQSPIVRAGEVYQTTTIFKFKVQ